MLTGFYVSSLVRFSLEESKGRGDLLANAIFHRASALVTAPDLSAALRDDEGLRSVLESSVYSKNVVYAAVVDVNGVALAHNDSERVGETLPPTGDMDQLLRTGPIGQARAIYSDSAKTLEVREPLVLGSAFLGSIPVGLSTLLIRLELNRELKPVILTLAATGGGVDGGGDAPRAAAAATDSRVAP